MPKDSPGPSRVPYGNGASNDSRQVQKKNPYSLVPADIRFSVACFHPAPAMAATPRKRRCVNSLGMEFVLIPAGMFIMGSPLEEAYRGLSEVQHPVTITRPFYMQTTEVTVDQWRAVMGRRFLPRKKGAADMPVVKVSWYDCKKFIRKLNQMTVRSYLLPTEAQWEYAARAGSTTAYFWGNTRSTAPVPCLPTTP
jgi:formylglycine-generating enzyme required for sulfatase activity